MKQGNSSHSAQPFLYDGEGTLRHAAKWRRLLKRIWAIRRPGGASALLRLLSAALSWEIDRRRAEWWHLQSEMHGRLLRAKDARAMRTKRMRGESLPAFDLRAYNPIGWQRNVDRVTATLGPIEWLPICVDAQRVIHPNDLRSLRNIHHLEDVQAFHADIATRAAVLSRLAACGIVTRLADSDERLRPLLCDDLYRLMTTDMYGMDADARALLSVRMRRVSQQNHSSLARAHQRGTAQLPLVSILLSTRRPQFLEYTLDSVAKQTYPRLELVLALHGDGFEGVDRRIAEFPIPVKILRLAASEPLGAVLNAATQASDGTLLAKMDDDDVYDSDHIWDLALAHNYSGAQLVGKGQEFVYLATSDQTIYVQEGQEGYCERYHSSLSLAGGSLIISRRVLDRVGGWRMVPAGVDSFLAEDVLRTGGRLYRTHGFGFMVMRHGFRHTWNSRDSSDEWFLSIAGRAWDGFRPDLAGIDTLSVPHPALDTVALSSLLYESL